MTTRPGPGRVATCEMAGPPGRSWSLAVYGADALATMLWVWAPPSDQVTNSYVVPPVAWGDGALIESVRPVIAVRTKGVGWLGEPTASVSPGGDDSKVRSTVCGSSWMLVVLLKPQFQARREEVGKKGVVRDAGVHCAVIGRFVSWAADHGLHLLGLALSPVIGPAGNIEFLLYLSQDNSA